jgi:hypothetical protein
MIYVRLEARDEAGNLSVHETETPILLGGPSPPVQIRDVRPLSRAAQCKAITRPWR